MSQIKKLLHKDKGAFDAIIGATSIIVTESKSTTIILVEDDRHILELPTRKLTSLIDKSGLL